MRQGEQLVAHLGGELAGRHQRNAGGSPGFRPGQDLQHRQTERQGLAGAGFRLPADVATGKDVRNGHLLDRECGGDAPLGEGVAQVLCHTELFESFRHVQFRIVVMTYRLPVNGPPPVVTGPAG